MSKRIFFSTLFLLIIFSNLPNSVESTAAAHGKAGEDHQVLQNFLNLMGDIEKHKGEANEVKIKKLEKLIGLSVQMGEKQREEAVDQFCKAHGKNDHKYGMEHFLRIVQSTFEHILQVEDCVHSFLKENFKFIIVDGPQFQLAHWLLMPKQDLIATQMRQILNPGFTPLCRTDVEKIDVLLEVMLNKPFTELAEIVKHFQKKHNGKNLATDMSEMRMFVFLGENHATKSALDVLKSRVQNVHKIHHKIPVDEIMKRCKKLQGKSIVEEMANDHETDLTDGQKEPTEQQIKEIFDYVKEFLVHFEPNSEDAQKFASDWLSHCQFVSNHVFKHSSEQKHYDEISRMLIVANLFNPSSRVNYFREKFTAAMIKEDHRALNWLLATLMNQDLAEIVDSKLYKCIRGQLKQKEAAKPPPTGLQRFRAAIMRIAQTDEKAEVSYFHLVDQIFGEVHKKGNVEKEVAKPESVDSLMAQMEGGHANDNEIQRHCLESGLNANLMLPSETIKQLKSVHGVMKRHKEMSMPRQKKAFIILSKLIQTRIRPLCQKREHWWEFWKTAEAKNEKEQRQHRLFDDFCEADKKVEAKYAHEKEGKHSEKIAEWFLGFLETLKKPDNLEIFNEIMKEKEWPKLQKILHTLLSHSPFYTNFKDTALNIVFQKMINPSGTGKLEGKHIEDLLDWYNEHVKSFQKAAGTTLKRKHPDNKLDQAINKTLRRRKRMIIVTTATSAIAYYQAEIIYTLILCVFVILIACPLACMSKNDVESALICIGTVFLTIIDVIILILIL